jgi:hypothetical protein
MSRIFACNISATELQRRTARLMDGETAQILRSQEHVRQDINEYGWQESTAGNTP